MSKGTKIRATSPEGAPLPHFEEEAGDGMRVHYLQHEPLEGPCHVEAWARARGRALAGTRLHAGETPPRADDYDLLVLLGGAMNIYDEARHPWLAAEKRALREALGRGRPVLGICLGAQLLADAHGARVVRSPHAEIGWHPVTLAPGAAESPLMRGVPGTFMAFHWHFDAFELPGGATLLGGSEACAHQMAAFGGRALGVQFHPESTPASVDYLLEEFLHEMTPGPYVQSVAEIRAGIDAAAGMNRVLEMLLDNLGGA